MKLKNLRLTLANVARTTNTKTLPVNETGTIREKNEDGSYSGTIKQYTVDCATRNGDNLKVKFGTDVAGKIAELDRLLENDVEVEISFSGLKLTPYALKSNDGSILSGVSAKADDFEIHKASEYDELIDLA